MSALSPQTTRNPFYSLLVVIGLVFCLTACAYLVMTLRGLKADLAMAKPSVGLMAVMEQHGGRIMLVEVGLLAGAAVLAMATDDFWSRRGKDDVN